MNTSDARAGGIVGALRRWALATPTSPAIVGADEQVLPYAALLRQVERIGSLIRAAGVSAQDRVAIVAASAADMIVAFLGVAAVAACAPLNPAYTDAEFAFFLDDLKPRLLLAEAHVAPQSRDVARRLGIAVREFTAGSASSGGFEFDASRIGGVPSPQQAEPPEAALILHTSGTTSRQKMVPLTQRNLCRSATNIARSLSLSPADCCLSIMPLFHIHGLVGTVLSTLVSGGTVKCTGSFTAASLLEGLTGFPPTWYTAVPTMHESVLARVEHGRQPLPSHSLRFIRSCSAPLSPRTLTRLENVFGVPVVEAYGMTEASHQIAINPLPPRVRKPGSVGVAGDTEIGVVGPDGAFLEPGGTGEIVIRGSSVTSGYLGDPSVNRSSFIREWLRTGDLGRIDEDGYLFISGRIKEIINRGGEKVAPREVEEVLLSHPAVAEAIAFAVPDERLGEDVGVAIVLVRDATPPDARSLREFAAARLAPFKLPRHVYFVDKIPRGATGKPQRMGLAARLAASQAPRPAENPPAGEPPATALEAMLVGIWCRVLRLKTIGIHDDFFWLGGDSLSAVGMLAEVKTRHGVTLTVADLLNAPTIRRLADVVAQAEAQEKPPRVAIIQAGDARPPFFGIGAGPRFRELARLLGQDQPFIALVYPAPDDLPFPCRIEDIARYHVRSIRDVQPTGPYFLGGWCVDGLVAYEVAQQLRAAGDEVALLVLFDTDINVGSDSTPRLTRLSMKVQAAASTLAFHARAAFAQPSLRDFVHYVTRHLGRIGERVRHRYLYLRFRFHGGGGQRQDDWRTIAAIQHRMTMKYEPQPYGGDVLLLHRSVRIHWGPRTQQTWRNLVPDHHLEIRHIPGDHGDMFDHPQVVVTAENLRRKLRATPERASPAIRR